MRRIALSNPQPKGAWHVTCVGRKTNKQASSVREEVSSHVERNGLVSRLRVCTFRRIQKRIFYARFSRFHGQRERKIRRQVCYFGNLASAFKMAASKQLIRFLSVEQAWRVDTALAEKLVEHNFGYLLR